MLRESKLIEVHLEGLDPGGILDIDGQSWLKENAGHVLDAVVDAIITIDAGGHIQSYNKATEHLFGYDSKELIGRDVSVLMPEPHKKQHQHYVDQYLETRQPKIIGIGRELEAVRKDGSVFPIYLAVSDIKSNSGKFFVGIIRDLSEQRETQQALIEQREAVAHVGRLITMGEMTASIAHEINQPLAAIAMYAQASMRLLARDDVDQGKVLDAIQKLNDQSLRAGEVIERIQRFVQNASGEKRLADVNVLLKEISHLAAGDARLHGIELTFELADDLPLVFVDVVQIHQVALNLVRNAIDAMFEIECRQGNRVLIRSALVDSEVRVEVEDQGPGVAPQMEANLFSAFQTTKAEGMGMGLSISKNIMGDHGGRLGFSNGEHGATFFFTLPTHLEERDDLVEKDTKGNAHG